MIISSDAKLDAVNDILAVIGESPVNTLENPQNVDVINAIRILDRVNSQIQSKGWSFNTVKSRKLNPDIYTKKIKWIETTLFIVGTDGTKYIRKDDYLYDFDNQKDTFESPIEIEGIFLVDYENMPVPVRTYITAKAARIFQGQTLGDPDLDTKLQLEEAEAWQALQEYDMDLNDYTIFDLENVQALKTR